MMKLTGLRVFAALLLIVVAGCGSGSNSAQYVITDLGALKAGEPSDGVAINASGLVVGRSAGRTRDGQYFTRRAFLWQSGVIRDLGALGGNRSEGLAINTSGIIVGVADVDDFSIGQAFIHDGYSMRALPVPSGAYYSAATGINDAGVIVGQISELPVSWTNGVVTNLGVLPGHDGGVANGINSAGHIAGASWVNTGGGGNNRAHRSSSFPTLGFTVINGHMSALPTLGGVSCYAHAINDHDQVVGNADTPADDSHACLWSNGTVTDLGTLGGRFSDALAIGIRGEVVGESYTGAVDNIGSDVRHATLYVNGKLHDLNDLIPNGSGWVLNTASGINDNGQIVGTGTFTQGNTHSTHGFLLTPK